MGKRKWSTAKADKYYLRYDVCFEKWQPKPVILKILNLIPVIIGISYYYGF